MRGLAVLILMLLVIRCKDEPTLSAPLVQTGFVKNISEQGMQLNGLVRYVGKGDTKVGFVYDLKSSPTIENSPTVVISPFDEGSIHAEITYDLLPNEVYYVRAFGKSGGQVVYGYEVLAQSKGSLPPVITSISPTFGSRGTTIILSGSNFSSLPSHVDARLGGLPLEVLDVTPTVLQVRIPADFRFSGSLELTVKIANRLASSAQLFTVEGSMIESFTPHQAVGGDTIRIFGQDFSSSVSGNTVMIGPHELTVLRASSTQVTARLPYYVVSGSHLVKVTSNQISTFSQTPFTFLDPWTTIMPTAQVPVGRGAAIALTIDGNFYYGLGGNNYRDFWRYNPGTKLWTQLANYPEVATVGCFGFSIGGKGYVGLGRSNFSGQADPAWRVVRVFDPATGLWTQKSDFPGSGRATPACFVINGIGYMGLGIGSGGYRDFWKYDHVNDTWTQLNNFPGTGGGVTTTFAANGKGYFCRGKEFWRYDPLADSWTRMADLPGLMSDPSSAVTADHVYVFGGLTLVNGYPELIKEYWEYFPTTDSWIRRPDIDVALGLSDSKSFSVGNLAYLYGGVYNNQGNGFYMIDLLVYDPHR